MGWNTVSYSKGFCDKMIYEQILIHSSIHIAIQFGED